MGNVGGQKDAQLPKLCFSESRYRQSVSEVNIYERKGEETGLDRGRSGIAMQA